MSDNAPDIFDLPEGSHARLSASSAHRWMHCTASAGEIDKEEPRPASWAAAEGTVAHFIAATYLEGDASSLDEFIGTRYRTDGHVIEVTQEMVEAVSTYVGYVRGLAADADLFVEVDLTEGLKELHPDFGGQADAVVYVPDSRTLYVIDYKHGAGVWVPVAENPQLRYYALGALLSIPQAIADGVEKIVSVVVQPRCQTEDPEEGVRSVELDPIDVLDFAQDILDAAREAAENPTYRPSDERCRWCPIAYRCEELRRRQAMVLADDFSPVFNTLTNEQLAEALAICGPLEERIKQLRSLAYERATQGNPPEGWKLVEKRAMRRWIDPGEAEREATTLIGDEVYAPPKLKSPAQLEKLKHPKAKEFVATFAHAQSSGYTLAPVTDKRPEVSRLEEDDFEDLTPKRNS